MSKTINCLGCGSKLQTEQVNQVGYVLSLEQNYCVSCYQLKHYGKGGAHHHPNQLPQLDSNSLVVCIASVMHLDLLFSHPIARYQPDATFVYLINQIDLLPDSTNLDYLLEQITRKAKRERIHYKDIILMSAIRKHDIEQLSAYLKSAKQQKIYLVGVQNSGKTTILKALTHNQHALAFKKAGLTQEVLVEPFHKHLIYDTPGLYQKGYLHQILPYETYKRLLPDQQIDPRIFQMKPNQTIFIEGLIAVTLSSVSEQSFVFYMDRNVETHKTNQQKIADLLTKKETFFKVYAPLYETKQFKVPAGKQQITFADFVLLHLEGPAHIEVTYPKDMHISIAEALFK